MKLIIIVKTDKDIPKETIFDCQAVVENTLIEAGVELKDINFFTED